MNEEIEFYKAVVEELKAELEKDAVFYNKLNSLLFKQRQSVEKSLSKINEVLYIEPTTEEEETKKDDEETVTRPINPSDQF